MRPGSVTTVAVTTDKYLFGLSGNPSACYTGFELFVKPAIYHMMGADAFIHKLLKLHLWKILRKRIHSVDLFVLKQHCQLMALLWCLRV